MRYFLGIDVGGTKSHALIAAEDGRAVGFGRGGSGNHQGVGYEGLAQVLQDITQQALEMAGLSRDRIAGAGFGVGGYDWPTDRTPTLEVIARLGLHAPVEVVNDTIIGLLAGAEAGWGVSIVCGTSNNCRGWDRHGREGRVVGNSMLFGEFGGAVEIVVKAVQEVSRAWARRGPQTALTGAFVEYFGARDATDLMEILSQDSDSINPEAAPLVFRVAEAGDPVAQAVIRWAAEELGSLAVGVIRQLDLQEEAFDVVLVGSTVNKGGPSLLEPLQQTVWAEAPQARFVYLTAPPVVGAALLGMSVAGVDGAPVRRALIDSTQALYDLRPE